jgi:hypothetical protein
MNRQILKLVSRYLVLVGLIFVFSSAVTRAGDFDYFWGLWNCDGSYGAALGDCRGQPNYPVDATETGCRYQAGSAYADCISELPYPSYELDFCDNARAARDNCVNTYLLDNDWDTYVTCWNASGVSQCE